MNPSTPSKSRETPDQRRAKAAFKAAPSDPKQADAFATVCKKTATRILTSGLLPALAFLAAHRDSGEEKQNGPVLDALAKYLRDCKMIPSGNGDIVQYFTTSEKATATQLRFAQTEALAFLDWLARFADARKKTSDGRAREDSQ